MTDVRDSGTPQPDAPPGGPVRRALVRLLPTRPEGTPLHPVTPWRRAWAPIAALAAAGLHNVEQAGRWLTELSLGWLALGLLVVVPAAAVYGFLSWWCTSYLVTETELRIRTGLLFRRTAHLRLDRIQAVDVRRPLLARAVGVAGLTLDLVGTDSKDQLAYLGEDEAVALRAELLALAAGMAPQTARHAGEAPAARLLRVRPRTQLAAVALRGSFWVAVVGSLVAPGVLYAVTGSVFALLALLVPALSLAGRTTFGRLLTEYDWTVDDSPDGLRIDRGLLGREHATIPPGRVQAVRVREPLLWRRLGWVRVELEVAGMGKEKGGTLLPVADRAAAAEVLARVLPGVDLAAAAAAAARGPRRARLGAPVLWRAFAHGTTDAVFVARSGLLERRTVLVPHAKVQSVRLRQGPWHRSLSLASVAVDNGAGGTAHARLRDADEAHALLLAQADRSRTGRRTARAERWLT
ncbi:PH domain-containing protein [Streptomyces sulphureus]|uniref:PH domain-containing protein n=1 Tax=Streptomyces sulphureus TaxID=47758 RepID=UPI0003790DE3|nr:PH domain-containing protein [Streptomyces sulphureus]